MKYGLCRIVRIDKPIRRAISKRTRFEIFKRDGFICQYCNRKPPEVTLEVDHIIAVASGGTDEFLNLITSCEDCNRGKSDKPLSQIISPDAELERLRLDQEICEAKRYLAARRELDTIQDELVRIVQKYWAVAFHQVRGQRWLITTQLSERQVKAWFSGYYGVEELERAFSIVSGYVADGKKFTGNQIFAYITGILKNISTHHQPTEAGNATE